MCSLITEDCVWRLDEMSSERNLIRHGTAMHVRMYVPTRIGASRTQKARIPLLLYPLSLQCGLPARWIIQLFSTECQASLHRLGLAWWMVRGRHHLRDWLGVHTCTSPSSGLAGRVEQILNLSSINIEATCDRIRYNMTWLFHLFRFSLVNTHK